MRGPVGKDKILYVKVDRQTAQDTVKPVLNTVWSHIATDPDQLDLYRDP